MSHWNHRVVRRTDKTTGEVYLAIHECYYDHDTEDTGKMGWTEEPVNVMGETLEELESTLDRMKRALVKPIIDDDDDVNGGEVCGLSTSDG